MRVAFQCARGAPGTTTLALATALELSSRGCEVLLVEADPAGGVLAAELGLSGAPSTVEFSTDPRMRDPNVFAAEAVHLLGDRLRLLTAPCSGRQSLAAWTAGAPRFVELAASLPGHVLIDLGRGMPAGAPAALEQLADRSVFAVRPRLPELAALIAGLREHDGDPSLRLICVVDQPGSRVGQREVREVLAPYATVMEIPWEPVAALQVHALGGHKWARSRLGTSMRELVDGLLCSLAPKWAPVADADPTLAGVAR
jgi:MinD-like ATPase involved in chromosome partitioning or flagellar assembly